MGKGVIILKVLNFVAAALIALVAIFLVVTGEIV